MGRQGMIVKIKKERISVPPIEHHLWVKARYMKEGFVMRQVHEARAAVWAGREMTSEGLTVKEYRIRSSIPPSGGGPLWLRTLRLVAKT